MPRKREDRTQRNYRMHKDTPDNLNQLALALGYKMGSKDNEVALVGAMLDDIGTGKILNVLVEYLHSMLGMTDYNGGVASKKDLRDRNDEDSMDD